MLWIDLRLGYMMKIRADVILFRNIFGFNE